MPHLILTQRDRLLANEPTATTAYLGSTELRAPNDGDVAATRYYPNGAVRTSSGGLTWQITDHHGTAELSVNATTLAVTRRRFDPYGNPRGIQPDWTATRGFVDGTTDPTGLTHLGAREYEPTTGRFISVDPILDPGNPQQINGYAYANNTPVTASDADGLWPCPDGDCRPNAPGWGGTPSGDGGTGPGGNLRPSDSKHRRPPPSVDPDGYVWRYSGKHGTKAGMTIDGTLTINGLSLPPGYGNAWALVNEIDKWQAQYDKWGKEHSFINLLRLITIACERVAGECEVQYYHSLVATLSFVEDLYRTPSKWDWLWGLIGELISGGIMMAVPDPEVVPSLVELR